MNEGIGLQRSAGAVIHLFDRNQIPGLAVDDDIGNTARCRTNNGQTQRHRFEVHNTEWLVDRRGDEHGRCIQNCCNVGLGKHLRDEDDALTLRL